MIRKVASGVVVLGIVGALGLGGMSAAGADSANAASVVKGGACTLYDGNGNVVVGDFSAVVTSSGNVIVRCDAQNVANSTGQAVKYNDFGCNADGHFTTDSRETVSASGNASLMCKASI